MNAIVAHVDQFERAQLAERLGQRGQRRRLAPEDEDAEVPQGAELRKRARGRQVESSVVRNGRGGGRAAVS